MRSEFLGAKIESNYLYGQPPNGKHRSRKLCLKYENVKPYMAIRPLPFSKESRSRGNLNPFVLRNQLLSIEPRGQQTLLGSSDTIK
jgi:hypothetical protein